MEITQNNLVVDINQVFPNDFNPKPDYKSDPELLFEFNKIKESLKYNGQIDPVIVRKTLTGYELINGYHRWQAMKELGYTQIEIKDLGELSRTEAIKKALSCEELKIPLDVLEVAKLLKELKKTEENLAGLPYTDQELADKIALLEFNFDEFNVAIIEDKKTEDSNKAISALERQLKFYFPFENKEDFDRVAKYFRGHSKGVLLDTGKLLKLIPTNENDNR